MHLVYIDDSADGKARCFSALIVPADEWHEAHAHLIGMRRAMKASDGIYTTVELHATDWLGGRGRIAPHMVPRGARARLYQFALASIAMLPSAQLINAYGHKGQETTLFERLLNRIDTNMRHASSQCVLISDEGKSYDSLLRRMRRYNYIPSQFGAWADGSMATHVPVDRIIEDLNYRDSSRSYFVQAADFCAFSLLRYEKPTSRIIEAGLRDAFEILSPIIVRQAYARDHRKMGIIRA